MLDADLQPSSTQLVVFTVGGAEYALGIGEVREIIRYATPRGLGTGSGAGGVISLRGKVIPICELAGRLGTAPGPAEQSKILVVEHEGRLAGLIVDGVEEVLSVDAAALQPPPAGGDALVDRIVQLDGRLIVTLRAGELCGDDAPGLRLVA